MAPPFNRRTALLAAIETKLQFNLFPALAQMDSAMKPDDAWFPPAIKRAQ